MINADRKIVPGTVFGDHLPLRNPLTDYGTPDDQDFHIIIIAPKAQFQLVAVCDVVDLGCPPAMVSVCLWKIPDVDAPLSRDRAAEIA